MLPKTLKRKRARSLNRTNRLRKTIRRTKSAEKYTNIKAEKIGEGGYGIVSRPPARCAHFFSSNSKNINQRNVNSTVFQETYYKNPNYISKLGEWGQAKKELEIGNIIKENIPTWRKYYCFIEFICGAPEDKHIRIGVDDFQDTYAIAPYCGVTLNQILDGNYYINPKELCSLLEELKELCSGLQGLHNLQIYHQDIHDGNILFNPKDKRLRWIDFGLAIDLFDKKNNGQNNWQKHPAIITAKHFDNENLIFDVIEPTLEFIYYNLKELKSTNKFLGECYNEVEHYLDILPDRPRQINYQNKAKNLDKYLEFIEEFTK
jgi:serine/threonine protein kinase